MSILYFHHLKMCAMFSGGCGCSPSLRIYRETSYRGNSDRRQASGATTNKTFARSTLNMNGNPSLTVLPSLSTAHPQKRGEYVPKTTPIYLYTVLLGAIETQGDLKNLPVTRDPGLADHLSGSQELHLFQVIIAEPWGAWTSSDCSPVAVWEILPSVVPTHVFVFFLKRRRVFFRRRFLTVHWTWIIRPALRQLSGNMMLFFEIPAGPFHGLPLLTNFVRFPQVLCYAFL